MIDKKLAVGRIVIRKADHHDHYIDQTCTGRITEIRGHRIAYDRRPSPTQTTGTESRFMLDNTVVAVCDTEAELHQIVKFDEMAFNKLKAVRESLNADWLAGVQQ